MKKALIIGPGDLGKELAQQLQIKGWLIQFVTSKTAARPRFVDTAIRKNDVVALTIPTFPDGKIAFDYAMKVIHAGKPIVIAEKSAFANYPEELFPHLDHIGINAMVGGGSEMLSLLINPTYPIESLCGVVNGCMNFILGSVCRGHALKGVLVVAKDKKLCEKKQFDIEQLFQSEILDVRYKMTTIANLLYPGEYIKAPEIVVIPPTQNYLDKILVPGTPFRFAISVYRERSGVSFDSVCLKAQLNDLSLRGGFVDKNKPSPMTYWPEGEDNILSVRYVGGGLAMRCGPGAGVEVTAEAMVRQFTFFAENN